MALAVTAIDDSDDLYRRFAAGHIRRDGTLASTAFMLSSRSKGTKIPDPEVSVDLAKLTPTPDVTLQRAGRPDQLEGRPDQGVVAVTAEFPRSLGLEVRHDPREGTPDEKENPAHSLILGNTGELALERCDRLAEAFDARWLVCPTGATCRVPRFVR